MHEKGLLHRDIKPQNIMVRLPADEAVLIDFGIAREFIPNLTQTHTVAYSPCFAPIEQYDEQEHRGEFTDVYALAATLYYVLTGTLPPIATMRVRRDRLTIPKHWSPELQNAIKQGMAVEPEDRPQTVADWLALLPKVKSNPVQSQLRSSEGASTLEVKSNPVDSQFSPSMSNLQAFNFETVQVNRQGQIIETIPGQARYYLQNLGQGVQLEMVQLPGGTFLMGTEEAEIDRFSIKHDGDLFRWESPQHSLQEPSVQIPPFFMGKTPITQDQWRVVVMQVGKIVRDLNPDPSGFKGGNRPVEQVSWYDAVEWCARLSNLTGKEYRLPSEAEWEYACLSGKNTPFHYGQAITTDLANFDGTKKCGRLPKGIFYGQTQPVVSFKAANSFGLYDMHGNVWEWCSSEGKFSESIQRGRAVLHGGSWESNAYQCRAASRCIRLASGNSNAYGFRVAL
ncbi:SUMF1/EgtB/PvdO family nonheme iron enzyme [Sodalinema gerasimenkoae]|uniref:SUMF1/EgtB/PvdO family nonheme iron enzyme n=1 Tax=Sodalinema gerasimenkoae TaxID=2862348 RepID=UPI001CA5AC5D|nr:SUMF1/EgtB/PvdO family nonheme iron enzyme [Sodalinema gerasimenkoae]